MMGRLAAVIMGALLTSVSALAEAQEASSDGDGGGFDVHGAIDALEEHAVPWAMKIVGALVALFIGWLVAGWAGRRVRAVVKRRNLDATLGHFFANVARWLILVAVVLGVLGVFGIETSTFAAVIGASALAVGLAFQGTLSNFAAGVMLLVFRPFKVDDYVEIGDESGVVREIELFTTELKTPDGKKKIVPNSKVWGDVITNYSAYPQRRVDVDVGVDYSASVGEVRAILERVAANVEGGLDDPAPMAFLKGLGGSSVDWQVRVWCKTEDYWTIHQRVVDDVKAALDAEGIGIPFPQMDVHLDPEAMDAFRGGSKPMA